MRILTSYVPRHTTPADAIAFARARGVCVDVVAFEEIEQAP